MRRRVIWLCLLLAGGPAAAQTLPAVVLTPTVSADVRAAWDALEAAKARWAAIQEKIAAENPANWPCGWEFSSDFRVMLPSACPVIKSLPAWTMPTYSMGNVTTGNAAGTLP